VLIKLLYVVLVLSFVALVWAAGACYVRVRRHLDEPKAHVEPAQETQKILEERAQSGSSQTEIR
jgi:hypothetical protein